MHAESMRLVSSVADTVLPVSTTLNSPLAFDRDTEIDLQLSTIQSAPAALSSGSETVVRQAITRAPPAFPARIPAGTSSTTTQSRADTPSNDAPFRYGSGSGFPFFTSSEVSNRSGIGSPAA